MGDPTNARQSTEGSSIVTNDSGDTATSKDLHNRLYEVRQSHFLDSRRKTAVLVNSLKKCPPPYNHSTLSDGVLCVYSSVLRCLIGVLYCGWYFMQSDRLLGIVVGSCRCVGLCLCLWCLPE